MIKSKQFATIYTEKGFTMLEMLFSFTCFCIVVSLIPLIYQVMFTNSNFANNLQRLEWNVFVHQSKKEIRSVDNFYVVNNRLVMHAKDQIITYETYNDSLRRRVDNSGHEPLLQNVKTANFIELNNGVKLIVTGTDNLSYEAIFRPYITVEGVNKNVEN